MRICLIVPPHQEACIYPPLGILSIASYLEKSGYKVTVIDCAIEGLDHLALKKRIKDLSPEVVGISIFSSRLRLSGLKCAQVVKEISKKITVVLGGVEPTFLDEEIMKRCASVDIIIRGEGEKTFFEFLSKGKKKDALGITYREDGRIVRNPDQPLIEKIDSLPYPAFHLIPMKRYFNQIKKILNHLRSPTTIIMASRGCWSNCTFCTHHAFWKKVRLHSPEYITDQIEFLQKNWGVKDLIFFDSAFPTSKAWLQEFHDTMKKRKININYRCLMRVDDIDEERLRLMKSTGCYFIDFGIESGSQRILDIIKKGYKLNGIKTKFDSVYRLGINIQGFFMVGFPQETKKDIYETFKLAQKLPFSDFHVDVTEVFPGCELSRQSNIDNEKWFQEPGVLFCPHPNFTEKELNYVSYYMRHRLLYRNFGRMSSFRLKTRPRLCSFIHLKNMVWYLMEGAYLTRKNPFAEFESEPWLFKILNLVLSFFYINIKRAKEWRLH